MNNAHSQVPIAQGVSSSVSLSNSPKPQYIKLTLI